MCAENRSLESCLAGLVPITTKKGKMFNICTPYNDSRFYLLAVISYQYAGMEQLSELKGKQFPDTSDLDFTIFTEGPIGPGERGEPIIVNEGDNYADIAFKNRFKTNTMIILLKKDKSENNNEEK
jgi:hypothetical protein